MSADDTGGQHAEAETSFLQAIERGDCASVQHWIKNGVDCNVCTADGTPPLILATIHHDANTLRQILPWVRNINSQDPQGRTFLHHAILGKQLDILQCAVETGVELFTRDMDGRTALHHSAVVDFPEGTALLLQAGADCNLTDSHQMSPLAIAAKFGHDQVCRHLVEAGSDNNLQDAKGVSILHWACKSGSVECVRVLLSARATLTHGAANGRAELMAAIRNESLEVVRMLLQHGAQGDFGRTSALHYVAKMGWVPGAEALCRSGAKIDKLDHFSWTPLMYAAKHGHNKMVALLAHLGCALNLSDKHKKTALHQAAFYGHLSCGRILIDAKAQIDCRDIQGNLPFMLSAWRGHADFIKLLVSASKQQQVWKVNATNDERMTALHFAADKGHQYCVEVLLREGADPSRPNKNGDTALMLAARSGHKPVLQSIVNMMLNNPNESLNKFNIYRKTALHMAAKIGSAECVNVLLSAGALSDLRDFYGKTPVLTAAEHGHAEVVRALIRADCDVDARTDEGWTALHLSTQHNHSAIVKQLLDAGLQPDILVSVNGITPSILAAAKGHYTVLDMLLKRGSDPNHSEINGLTALHKAARGGHANCAQLLLSHGASVDAMALRGNTPAMLAIEESFRRVLKVLLKHNCDVTKLDIFRIKPNRKFGSILDMLLVAGSPVSIDVLESHVRAGTLPRPLQQDQDMLEKIWRWASQPHSLQHLCRLCIRRTLGPALLEKVASLPLPQYLKDHVALKELDNYTS